MLVEIQILLLLNLKVDKLKSFTQYIHEAKKSNKVDSGDITQPYSTPQEIKDIMSRSGGDDSITSDWGQHHTSQDQGERRGAESIETTTDITPGMAKEREESENILKSVPSSMLPSTPGNTPNIYSNQEIADILNKRGILTEPKNKPWTKQRVDQVAQQALEKIKSGLMNIQPHTRHLGNDIESH